MYIDPIAFSLGPIQIHWYGIMYVLALSLGWYLLYLQTRQDPHISQDFRLDIVLYSGWGIIIGGRVGYVLFYGLSYWAQDWLWPLRLWEPGMSFHGGCLGVIIALYCLSRQRRYPYWALMDTVAPCVPLGLFFGRIGNFINGELWGRPTDLPWGMIFPAAGAIPRHPSPLYEAFGEGCLLFIILWGCVLWKRRRSDLFPPGRMAGLFLFCYGSIRFILEYWREPDPQWGMLLHMNLSMGQLLSFPMIILGGYLLCRNNTI